MEIFVKTCFKLKANFVIDVIVNIFDVIFDVLNFSHANFFNEMIFFVFFRFILRNNVIIDTDNPEKISKHEYAWYYVSFSNISQLIKNHEFLQEYSLPVHKNLITTPLTHSQIVLLKKNKSIWIKKIPSRHKGPESVDYYLILMTTTDCQLPGKIISQSNRFSIIKYKGPLFNLKKIVCVRDFDSISNISFNTRYNNQITQTFTEYPNSFTTYTPFRGLNGKDQCVSIVDSGIDIRSPWFSDNKNIRKVLDDRNLTDPKGRKEIKLNKLSTKKHRKIKGFIGYGDDVDDDDGHGTFLSGIVAGNSFCNSFTALYNGVAPESKLFIIDIKKKGKKSLYWPKNLSDLFEIPSYFNCRIQLNAWSYKNQHLLTQAIDWIAYNNPEILMIFPSDYDHNNFLVSPSDSKNVLTVGPSLGFQASASMEYTKIPIIVKLPNSSIIGYADPKGIPLFSSKIKDSHAFSRPVIYGDTLCLINTVKNEEVPSTCKIGLFTSDELIDSQYNIPIIKLSKRAKDCFSENMSILISPSHMPNDKDPLSPSSTELINQNFKYGDMFKIKPDVVAPSGPLMAPKSGFPYCNISGLTMKEGSSVSAAIISGNIALMNEYLLMMHHSKITPNGPTMKAMIIHSAIIPHKTYVAPSKQFGWGQPLMSSLLPDPSNSFGLHIFQNIELKEYTHKSFCFTMMKDGLFRATCTWFDLPRDPEAPSDISSVVSLILMIDGETKNSRVTNSHQNDFPSIDHFNTVKSIIQKVKKDTEIRIVIVTGAFSLDKPINFSLVVTGPFANEPYKNNSCNELHHAPCFQECENLGMYIRGFCSCASDYYGDNCQIKIETINSDYSSYGKLKRFEWKVFKFCPEKWSNKSYISLDLSGINNLTLGMNIKIGSTPSFTNYLCSLHKCPGAIVTHNNIKFPFSSFPQISYKKCLFLGLYSMFDGFEPYSFTFNGINVD
ncbi:hypothetical protein TRFO_06996 [Tritrichomonas foetus]|uniref:EGF-like domain-containing protein n=1 Tax=Tritrichomonas foetus TaxID=1144522 RepID=A0A1J4JVX8_9EUKA|nr:hypothetical protein TRFO_06996 [Tritrichomonas foetus]|eukprot:OHT02592.1 hypothetical protein TRFO_06996 [Tritrichomonas foetus]